jgi:hypothetical protein
MATVLEIVRGLSQAAANAYDGALDENGEPLSIGLNREEGHPVIDSRVMDGFKVRFAAEAKFADIVKFLKKEYRKITKSSVSLTEVAEADILVQTTSRRHTWVQASKQYKIGGLEEVASVRQASDRSELRSFEKQFQDFLSLSTDKRPSNDKSSKNPDTPEA